METLILSCDSFNREEILYNPSSYLNFIGRVVFCNHNQDFVTRDPGYCFQRAEIRDGADILMVMVSLNICSNTSDMELRHLEIIRQNTSQYGDWRFHKQ